MSYLDSTKVEVFPSARRGNTNVNSRLITEASLTGIINSLIDKSGFIISQLENFDFTAPLKFNLNGYIFDVDSSNSIINLFADTEAKNIYANIITINDGRYTELYGIDDVQVLEGETSNSSIYKGLEFTDTPVQVTEANKKAYSLLLFSRETTQSDWAVNNKAKFKFDTDSLDIEIDGGEL